MQITKTWRSFARLCATAIIVGCCLLFLGGCGLNMRGTFLTTKIAPAAGEDLAGSCVYDLLMLQPQLPQRAVLVVYERGDTGDFFEDVDVQQMAAVNRLAMVFAHQCNAASYDDIQDDATKGPGRTLLAALAKFAAKSGHPELGSSPLILFGFSASAVLAATTTHMAPQRVIGTVEYAMASAFLDVTKLAIPAAALRVPTLVISNATDKAAGTEPSLTYFENGRSAGGIWGYGVQNRIGHCCTVSTKALAIPWIEGVLALEPPGAAGGLSPAVVPGKGTVTSFICSPDGTVAAGGIADCRFTYAALMEPAQGQESSWLPDQTTAAAWLRWVTNPSGN